MSISFTSYTGNEKNRTVFKSLNKICENPDIEQVWSSFAGDDLCFSFKGEIGCYYAPNSRKLLKLYKDVMVGRNAIEEMKK
tara:strand:- start:770 stop:1012 length:243 start_codon:yes stop_codon:yes gene_type:complete